MTVKIVTISIHALRKESDVHLIVDFRHSVGISIHALRKESDPILSDRNDMYLIFQSTLSVRRATQWSFERRLQVLFQSTLSVRRATFAAGIPAKPRYISIHALRKESDSDDIILPVLSLLFQSTLSVRRATQL